MTTLVRALLTAGIVLASLVLGVMSGGLMVRYVFPAPALLQGGAAREGTPVQIIAFLGTFFLVTVAVTSIGMCVLGAAKRRGLPKA